MKAVGESMKVPLLYYQNNLIGAINLLKVNQQFNAYSVVFETLCRYKNLLPTIFFANNCTCASLLIPFKVMKKYKCQQLIFSSSCTVYGNPKFLPITEDHPVGDEITNVYGKTKHFIEEMLKDVSTAEEVRRLLLK